ncbi:MAG: ATP-binding protein [Myxococcales bacterium]|nr:ATP-binding protein [Myxococcales bacterium]
MPDPDPAVSALPVLSEAAIARVRALWRNLAWQLGPEAIVGPVGQEATANLPDAANAGWLATVRTLHGGPVSSAAADLRAKSLAEAREPLPVTAVCRLDEAANQFELDPLARRALEVVAVTTLDAATAHAARVLAGRLQRQGATDIAMVDDAFGAAGLGAGVGRTLAGPGGALAVRGAVVEEKGQLVLSRALLGFLEPGVDAWLPLEPHVEAMAVPQAVLDAVREMRAGWLDALERAVRTGRIVVLAGTHGFGGAALVQLVAERIGIGSRAIGLGAVYDLQTGRPTEAMAMLHAEARLLPVAWALLHTERAATVWRDDPLACARLVDALWRIQRPIVLVHEGPVAPDVAARLALAGGVLQLDVPPLRAEERERLLLACLRGADVEDADSQALAAGARQHALGVEQVASAVAYALQKAQSRAARAMADGKALLRAPPTGEELRSGCGAAATNRLRTYGSRVDTTQDWTDLVLEADTLESVHNLARFARTRDKLFTQWGFERLMPYGRALSAMFSGPSGTGKTMVAGLIAKDLGIELYRVDLSRVVSKYIGETEERLGALFSEASQVGAALLFDEADSMFGQRTEIKSSHDRYANLEVNYLLQRLEEFDGVVILTTNFATSIDEAFLRRIRFRVQFPFPSPQERARLWEVLMPPELPQDEEGLDLEWMGQTFELSGGHVRNAVLRAAMIMAHKDTPLSMRMLYEAAASEYKELGKLAPHYPFDD